NRWLNEIICSFQSFARLPVAFLAKAEQPVEHPAPSRLPDWTSTAPLPLSETLCHASRLLYVAGSVQDAKILQKYNIRKNISK
ncbi:MAG: hypothetical protein Q4E44_01640, partial [bacterium]|nr:hypothetical protein [bacterium]